MTNWPSGNISHRSRYGFMTTEIVRNGAFHNPQKNLSQAKLHASQASARAYYQMGAYWPKSRSMPWTLVPVYLMVLTNADDAELKYISRGQFRHLGIPACGEGRLLL